METKLYTPEKVTKMKNQNIQVFTRLRPMNNHERNKNSINILECQGSKDIVVKSLSSTTTKTFSFDKVFGEKSKQIEVYKYVVAPLIEEVLLGYNCTVFAYGQTGTGKTFTMEGEKSTDANLTWENDPLSGIVPRALSQLFDELQVQNVEFTVRVSFLELYNEEIFDLLSPNDLQLKNLRLYEDPNRKGSVIINGLEEVTVHNKHEVYAILERGSVKRQTAATLLNANSSRSHSIFTITIHIKESTLEGEELVKIGKLNLVDLAGSENIGRSGAENKRAREAGSINQSLLTLGRVITALVERTPHIPYRESKLTRLLQDSLGGRTQTSIIATVSPASMNHEETLSTLDYAHRAKNIMNRPEVNQKLTKKAMMKAYTEEIERLRRDLLATREKNGVFMDKDNYDNMMAQLDIQGHDLSDRVTQIRELQESVEQKDIEIEKTQYDLREAREELNVTKNILEDIIQKLDMAYKELELTKIQRDEKAHLLGRHMETEKNLTGEAVTLLNTAETATEDLSTLQYRLNFRKNVLNSIHSETRKFKGEINPRLDSFNHALDTYRNEKRSLMIQQQCRIEHFYEKRKMQYEESAEDLKDVFSNMEKIKELLGDTDRKCRDLKYNLVDCNEETEVLIKEIEDEINEEAVELETFVGDRRLSIVEQKERINKFITNIAENKSHLLEGMTPPRKDFQFPRQISATSPHEVILNRFRKDLLKSIDSPKFDPIDFPDSPESLQSEIEIPPKA